MKPGIWLLAVAGCAPDPAVFPVHRPVETDGADATETVAPGRPLEVPSDCVAGRPGVFVDGRWHSASLQGALDDAPAGAVVRACAWTWLGPFTARRPVILEGAGATVLEGYGPGTVLTVPAGSTVRGLTIRGGDAPVGGGLRLDGPGGFTVDGCTIEDNVAEIGGGIAIGGGARVTVQGSTVRRNTADTGGGLSVGPLGTLQLVDTEVSQNAAALASGVALDNASLFGGTIVDNLPLDTDGAGIHTLGDCLVEDATISRNHGTSGIVVRDGTLDLTNVLVTDNGGPLAAGGGLSCVDATVTLDGTEISGNQGQDGGGVWASGCTLVGGTISGNEAVDDGGGVVLLHSTLSRSVLSANVAGGYPSGVWLVDGASLIDSRVEAHGGDWGAIEAGPDSRIVGGSIVANRTCAVLVSGQVTLDGSTVTRNDAGACRVGVFDPDARLVSFASDWGSDVDDNTVDLSWSGSTYGYGPNATFTCQDEHGCQPVE